LAGHSQPSRFFARAFFERTLALAAAAFFARAVRSALLIRLAAALPPCRPVSLKNSSISVREPNVFFSLATPPQHICLRGKLALDSAKGISYDTTLPFDYQKRQCAWCSRWFCALMLFLAVITLLLTVVYDRPW
jgi:hypothetical protein